VTSARALVTVDDERIRVTTWTFEHAGDETGAHVHEYDYVVVPVSGGTFAVTDPDGATRELIQRAGTPYVGVAGTAHTVASAERAPVTFVEIELKR
jgi:hypothetical protein